MRKGKHILVLTSLLAGLTLMTGCSAGSRTNAAISVTDGKDGKDGKDGVDGIDGKDGKDGEKGDKGEKGDTGEAGKDGTNGTDGSSVLTGNGEPDATLGTSGDSYIDMDTFDYYVKSDECWVKTGNLKGETGKDGETPEVTVGENGNWFVNGEDTGKKATIDVTEYIVTYSLDGGTLPSGYEMMVKVKTGECIFDLPTPTKTDYIFEGWYIGEGENEGKFTSTTPVTSDITLTAHWKSIYSQTFTVRWLNYDGTLLTTSEDVSYNTYPSYPGEGNPTREPDDTYEYTFSGWSPYLTRVTEDCSYVAQFSKSIRKYSITFDMQDKGTITSSSYVSGTSFYNNVFKAEAGSILSSRNFKITYNDDAGTNFISSWYYDAELTKKVTFPLLVSKDMTLYPKWETEDNQLSYAYNEEKGGYIVKEFLNKSSSYIDTVRVPNVYDDGTNGSHPVIEIRDAFRNVTNVGTVVLPDSITKIGSGCFASSSVQYVTLPKAITAIPDNCFNNSSLKEIEIPDTVTELGAYAFANTSIVSIDLPDAIEVLPNACFYGCSRLKNVHVPANLTTFEDSVFTSCSSLYSFECPENLTVLPWESFMWSGITLITLNSNLTEIGGCAFRGCQNLESIIIPSNVKTISGEAFNSSMNLTIYAEPTERPTGWPENFAGSGPVVFWYSETNPGAKEGNYWHYVDDIPTKW